MSAPQRCCGNSQTVPTGHRRGLPPWPGLGDTPRDPAGAWAGILGLSRQPWAGKCSLGWEMLPVPSLQELRAAGHSSEGIFGEVASGKVQAEGAAGGEEIWGCLKQGPAPSRVSSELTPDPGKLQGWSLPSPWEGCKPLKSGFWRICPSSWCPWAETCVCDFQAWCWGGVRAQGDAVRGFLAADPGLGGSPRTSRGFLWLLVEFYLEKNPFAFKSGRSRVRQGWGALGVAAGWAQPGPGFPGGEFGTQRGAGSWQAQSTTPHEPRDASTKPCPARGQELLICSFDCGNRRFSHRVRAGGWTQGAPPSPSNHLSTSPALIFIFLFWLQTLFL